MASNRLHVLLLVITAVFFAAPTAAFGAGNIRDTSGLFGYNARHGDIGTLVASLPLSFLSSAVFGPINVKRVYLGNWLRDYSQIIDVNALKKVPEPLLRAVVSILGFVQFGYATGEFDITAERLGVYRPEEHIGKRSSMFSTDAKLTAIDNPKVSHFERGRSRLLKLIWFCRVMTLGHNKSTRGFAARCCLLVKS